MSTLEQFFSKSSTLPVGSVKSVSSNTSSVPPSTFTDASGTWVKTGLVYSQVDYPELYSQLGKIDSAHYLPAYFGAGGNTYDKINYINNTYYATAGSGNVGNSIIFGTSTNAVTWTQLSPIPVPGSRRSVMGFSYTGSLYVISTDQGQDGINAYIATSPDLTTWTTRYTSPVFSIQTSKYLGGKHLFISNSTPCSIGSSTDFVSWTPYNIGTISTVYAAAYGSGGLYLVSAGAGQLRSSTNGVNWTVRTSGTTSTIRGIVYDNSKYVVAGNGGMIRTSTDLVTWTARTSGTTSILNDLAYGTIASAPVYVTAGVGGVLRSSTDATTWTTRTSGTTSSIVEVSYANGNFFYGALGSFATSTDGTTWTNKSPRFNALSVQLSSGVYANNLYVVVGTGGVISTSLDAVTWTARTSGTTSNLNSIIYVGGLYVTGGAGGNLRSSTDAVTWTALTTGTTSSINSIIYDNSKYVVAGAGGMIRTSTDLVTWAAVTSGTTSVINAIVYENSLYTVAGAGGMIRTSTDLVTWTARTSGTTTIITKLSYTNNLYFALGSSGVGLTSTDSITWTGRINLVPSSSLISPAGVQYIGSTYVQISYSNSTYSTYYKSTSTNGITWQTQAITVASNQAPVLVIKDTNKLIGFSYTTGDLYYIFPDMLVNNSAFYLSGSGALVNSLNSFYAQGKYYVVQEKGIVYTSTNLSTWQPEYVGIGGTTFYKLMYNSGSNLFVRQTGSNINTSTDFVTWDLQNTASIWTSSSSVVAKTATDFYLFAGPLGIVSTSTNAVDWKTIPNSPSQAFKGNDVEYNNSGLYIVVGDAGQAGTSTDAVTWTSVTTGTTSSLISITYGNGRFVAAGITGALISSTNGTIWQTIVSTTENILEVKYDGTKFKYITDTGGIGTSTDGVIWNHITKVRGINSTFTSVNIDGPLYIGSVSGNLYISNNTDQTEYSPSYDINTSFLVPTVTTTSSFATSTNTLDSEATNVFYIKAKL